MAEARALFLAYDPGTTFWTPEDRLLVADTAAEVGSVSHRVAFSRRVGILLEDVSEAKRVVKGRRIGLRSFSLRGATAPAADPRRLLEGLDATVDLDAPEYEFTYVRGKEGYMILTRPNDMRQAWHLRRPRGRAFFHPSAIFPKLSRAMVNLTRVKEGEVLLDPFAGTGSLLLEAGEIGVLALGLDLSPAMTKGAVANMHKQGQDWLGIARADAFHAPVSLVDAIATDAPYGRASTTHGRTASDVVNSALETLPRVLRPGRRMLLMHPKQAPVAPGRELEVEEEHDIYTHKRLTRTITILRRR